VADQASSQADDLPPCLIYIDKEGRMFHQGEEMTHQGVLTLLKEHITLDDNGRYIIELEGQKCLLEVEDTPLVVRRAAAEAGAGERFRLSLSDGTEEHLDPELLWISEENVIYTRVRGGTIPARFLRPAYYQIAEKIEETENGFGLRVGDRVMPLLPGRP